MSYFWTVETFLYKNILFRKTKIKHIKKNGGGIFVHFNRRKMLTIYGILLATALSGCEEIQSSDLEDGYNTEVSMSAVEYTIFISKQVSVLTNVLTTRMSMADAIVNDGYDVSTEIESTDEAISKVTATKDEIEVTMPAKSQETDRENLLSLTEDALDALNTYMDNLKSNDKSAIKNSISELKNCMIAISGEANVYYQ